jgi:hypothetical protein
VQDKFTEPDIQKAFTSIKNTNITIHAVQLFFQSSVIPLISQMPTVHREVILKKNEFLMALESKINAIIQKQIDGKIRF